MYIYCVSHDGTRYLKLTRADLCQWKEDPEEFMTAIESGSSVDSVRSCAEMLYLSLLQNHRAMLTPSVQLYNHTCLFVWRKNKSLVHFVCIKRAVLCLENVKLLPWRVLNSIQHDAVSSCVYIYTLLRRKGLVLVFIPNFEAATSQERDTFTCNKCILIRIAFDSIIFPYVCSLMLAKDWNTLQSMES